MSLNPGPSTSFEEFVTIEEKDSEFLTDSNVDPLFLDEEGEENEFVYKFLEEELHFDYRERVAEVAAESKVLFYDEEEEESEVTEYEPIKNDTDRVAGDQQHVVNKKRKPRKLGTKLPAALKGLMGEANLRCARGDKETAVKICLEIIRQVPTAAEPFQTLASIYEETGDIEKAVHMSLVAAHLSSPDISTWVTLADQSEEIGNIRQAITCLTKAINMDIKDLSLHQKRAVLLESIGDKRTAVKGYMRLLYSLDNQASPDCILYVARFVAELCHKEGDVERANEALEIAVQKTPQLITFDFVNLHLELLLALKNYKRCLEMMVAFCDLIVEAETGPDGNGGEIFVILDVSIPDSTPVDILSNLGVVLIHMNAGFLVERVLAPLMAVDVAEVGELYLDVAEAWVEKGLHEEACQLFAALVASEAFSLPGVWLKYAESLVAIGRLDEAVDAYKSVLAGAPGHVTVRLTLTKLLHNLDRDDEALNLLPESSEDPALIYARASLLASNEFSKPADLIASAMDLFSRHSLRISSRKEAAAISSLSKMESKRATVRSMQIESNSTASDSPMGTASLPNSSSLENSSSQVDSGSSEGNLLLPTPEEEWNLFLSACQAAYSSKMYDSFHSLTTMANVSTVLGSSAHKMELDLLSAIAAHLADDSYSAYNLLRGVILKNPYTSKVWSLFNLIAQRSEDTRHHRFLMRMLARKPDHRALAILHANNCLVSGTYKYAMHEYHMARGRDSSALVNFLLALTYMQIAAQKFTSRKHSVTAQTIGLMSEYRKQRNKGTTVGEQEFHYNMGRVFQHLGLFNSAVQQYQLSIEFGKSLTGMVKENSQIFDLTKEAAFNLHLIYLQSGNPELAAIYINMIQV